MAQDTRKITIEILGSGGNTNGYAGGVTETEKTNGEINLSKLTHPMNHAMQKIDKSLFGKAYIFSQIYSTAKSLVKSGAEMTLNRYFNMSENYLAENTYNNIKTNIGKVTGLASSITSGVMAGGVIGGFVGAAAWGTNEWMSYNSKLSGYHSALNMSNMNTAFSNTRSSLYDNGKGTEN